MNYRLCPECQRIVSPTEEPRPDVLSQCPHCRTIVVFDEDLMLRPATLPEIRRYQLEAECAEAN